MSGLRILHVIARDLGPISEWSGLNSPGGVSSLVTEAAEMGGGRLDSGAPVFNAIWFSPFTVSTDAMTVSKERMKTGSLYGIRNHFKLDPDITSGKEEDDFRHLEHFCVRAHEQGVMALGDLVFNHVALDHPLAQQEEYDLSLLLSNGKQPERVFGPSGKLIGLREEGSNETFYLKFMRNPRTLKLVVDGSLDQEWADVAKINYESPAAVNCFIRGEKGQKGLWKQVIDWYLNRGFDGFRCDAAYKISQPVWKELIDYTRARKPEAVYIAETLGGSWDNIRDNISNTGFDFCSQSTHPWNNVDPWYFGESQVIRTATKGGMGMAESHDVVLSLAEDMEGKLRDQFRDVSKAQLDKAVSAICLRDYGISGLLSPAVCMERGFNLLLGANSVFKEPEHFEDRRKIELERSHPDHPKNISREIRQIHNYLDSLLNQQNASIHLEEDIRVSGDMIEYECSLYENGTDRLIGKQTVVASSQPENGAAFAEDGSILPESPENEDTGLKLVLGSYLAAVFKAANRTPPDQAPALVPRHRPSNAAPGPINGLSL